MNTVLAFIGLAVLSSSLDGYMKKFRCSWAGWRKNAWWYDRIAKVIGQLDEVFGAVAVILVVILGFAGELI